MRRLYLCLFLATVLFVCCEKKTKTDSEKHRDIEHHAVPSASPLSVVQADSLLLSNLHDTLQIKAYLEFAQLNLDSAKADKAILYAEKALTLIRQGGGESLDGIHCLNLLGQGYLKLSKPDSALYHMQEAEKLLSAMSLEKGTEWALCYENTGSAYYQNRAYDKAIEYFSKGQEIREELAGGPDSEALAHTLNNIGAAYEAKWQLKKALEFHERALRIREKILDRDHPDIGVSATNLGVVYTKMGNNAQGATLFEKALRIRQKVFGNHHIETGWAHSNLGTVYGRRTLYAKAIHHHSKAAGIWKTLSGKEDRLVAHAYNNLGLSYLQTGDYDRGLLYHKKVTKIWSNAYGPEHPYIAINYDNLANCYMEKGAFAKAISYERKALNIREKYMEQNPLVVALSLNNLAVMYQRAGKIDSTLLCHERALEIKERQKEVSPHEMALSYANIGATYADLGHLEKAEYFQKEALRIREKVFRDHHQDITNSLINLSLLYLTFEKPDSVEKYLELSRASLRFDFQDTSFDKLEFPRQVHNYLENRATHFQRLHEKTLDRRFKDSVRQCLDFQLAIDNYYQKTFSDAATKQFYASISQSIYERAIDSYLEEAFSGNHPAKLFRFFEAHSNRSLLENITANKVDHFSLIPDSLLIREKELSREISKQEKKKFQESYESEFPNDSLIGVIENTIFELKHKRDQLIGIFKEKYPDYWNLKYNLEVATLKEVQNHLQKDQTLIEYFVGDSSIFLFAITKDTFDIEEIRRDFPLSEWVDEMRNAMFAHSLVNKLSETKKDSLDRLYLDRAWGLYEKLLKPVSEYITDKEKLVIVPDGVLGYLPFDALLTQPADDFKSFNTPVYLIRSHQISYAYSATLWLDMQNKKISPRKRIIAFAPDFPESPKYLALKSARDSLYRLEFSLPEVHAIADIWGADVFPDSSASLQAFLEKAPDYRILHLSTHGKADDRIGDYCFLAFTKTSDSLENLLYVRDLYNMRLNADMVVLSACETGLGKLQRGEGVLSLARGFVYAGAKSIISTLWSVNEKPTKEIMETFYINLKKGMHKDAALRQAKLTYLDSPDSAAPFYWAAFTAVGDMSPVSTGSLNWLFFIGALLLPIVFVLLWKRRLK